MRTAVIDIESFWSKTHTLTKMSPIEYVMHPDTEIISIAIKFNDYPTDVFFGEDKIRQVLGKLDWSDTMVIGHNCSAFDSMILSWRFGLKPKMWGCTLAMARPLYSKTVGLSLGKLVAHYGLGVKDNTALVQTQGKHLADFTPDEIEAMKDYNRADTEQCYALFKKLKTHYTAKELWHIDASIRMLVDAQFEVDVPMLETALSIERDQKRKHILMVAKKLRTTPGFESSSAVMEAATLETLEEAVRAELASAPKFAALLTACGVEVPMKPSPSNPEKQVPALAKSDEAFVSMQEHDDPIVAAAARARLAVKSTMLETRIEKFLEAQARCGGKLPIPTHYCGADTTGRRSGWGYNPLNLSRVGPIPKTSDALRNSMGAPRGYKVVVADLSGIEMRFNHTLWKVPKSMALWQESLTADLYKATASEMYSVPEAEVTKAQRQYAKVLHLACIAEGELVLTDSGLVPIEKVTLTHRVWDGVEWCSHEGPVYQGERKVITHDSLTATRDHIVFLPDGSTCEFGYAADKNARLASTGDGGRPLRSDGNCQRPAKPGQAPTTEGEVSNMLDGEMGRPRECQSRQDQGLSAVQPATASSDLARPEGDRDEAAVQQPERRGLGELRGPGNSIQVSQCPGSVSVDTTEPRTSAASGAGAGPSREQRALRGREPSVGDKTRERPEHEAGQRVVCRSPQVSSGVPACEVRGQHDGELASEDDVSGNSGPMGETLGQTERRVWDLLNCGPRNRFTVSGKLVHNCGYGMGPAKFQDAARLMGGLTLTPEQSAEGVAQWRALHIEIVKGWRTCHSALQYIHDEQEVLIDPWGLFTTCSEGIRLPSGRIIRYPGLHQEEGPDGKKEWWYGQGRHRARIYAGKITENLCQAGSRDVMYDILLDVFKETGFRHVLEVYDEGVWIVPDSEAQGVLDAAQKRMRTPPAWWPELLTYSEGDIAQTYGAAK